MDQYTVAGFEDELEKIALVEQAKQGVTKLVNGGLKIKEKGPYAGMGAKQRLNKLSDKLGKMRKSTTALAAGRVAFDKPAIQAANRTQFNQDATKNWRPGAGSFFSHPDYKP